MWWEDFDGMQSEWRYRRERKTRERLSPAQFYERFYRSTDVREEIVLRLLSLHADFWKVESELIRPHDNYVRISGCVDEAEFVRAIESAFGIAISESDSQTIDGSFDSIARYVSAHARTAV